MNHNDLTLSNGKKMMAKRFRPIFLPQSFCLFITALVLASLSALHAAEPIDSARFEKEILVPAARDAIQMEVLPGGDVIFAEFWGTIKRWDAKSGGVSILGTVPTYAKGEIGLLGKIGRAHV